MLTELAVPAWGLLARVVIAGLPGLEESEDQVFLAFEHRALGYRVPWSGVLARPHLPAGGSLLLWREPWALVLGAALLS